MPMGFGPIVNFIEIPRVPLEHKFKKETKALTQTKTLVKALKNKTNLHWNFPHRFFFLRLLLHVASILTNPLVYQAIIP